MRIGDHIQRRPENRAGGWRLQFPNNPGKLCKVIDLIGSSVRVMNEAGVGGEWYYGYFIVKDKHYYIERFKCSLK